MCRIAGIIHAASHKSELTNLVKSMSASLEHGGPDDEGFYTDEANKVCFGHRRLSIIDIAATGHQPMHYQQSRYVITYNGELYNYKLLREELKASGHYFTTQSDTEVVLAAYAAWGTASFERLEGMYAFAIYDTLECTVIMARDPSGIKPLYYALTDQGLSFASEIKAMKLLPHLQEANKDWPVYFMAYGHLPEPITTLKLVQPLPKGNYFIYNVKTAATKLHCFFRYQFIEKINHRLEAITNIRSTLNQAVKQHLIADIPVGVFLSGGLDSSIIALLANKHQPLLNTVSLFFSNKDYSEKKYQDALRAQLNCDHHQFLLEEKDFHLQFPSIISDMDLPCCDGINTWFISKYAKEAGLKTVLSGVGGDELYGGYPSFKRIATAIAISKLPKNMLRKASMASSKKIKRMAYLSIDGAIGKYLFLRGQFIPSEIAAFLQMEEQEVWEILSREPQLENTGHLTAQNQACWLETNLYMQNQLLRDADVMSMAHGLEIRLPFLDKSFMELSLKISSQLKYSGQLGKQLLIDSFKDQLPRIIWDRPKMGFTFPFREWLSNQQYGGLEGGKQLNPYHEQLKNSQLHWSQFFTLYMLKNSGNAY